MAVVVLEKPSLLLQEGTEVRSEIDELKAKPLRNGILGDQTFQSSSGISQQIMSKSFNLENTDKESSN